MKNEHLTETEIQQYALGDYNSDQKAHINTCQPCATNLANYRLIFSEMRQLPKASFDFDIADEVLLRLPAFKPAASRDEAWFYVLIYATLGSIGIPVYFCREYLFLLFRSLLPVALPLILFTILVIFGCQCFEFFRTYRKQMDALDI